MPAEFVCTYLLPLRRTAVRPREVRDFAGYFRALRHAGCDVLVVDGSPPEVFARHSRAWRGLCRHAGVDPRFRWLNGKVNAIHTGVPLALSDKIIVADDDIRYRPGDIERMARLLDGYEAVRPQNYFRRLPWWARLESARMLLNRAFLPQGDYPGTCGFTRALFERAGDYDGDVLFDNEEMIRHFAARRARMAYAVDFFVEKRPPSFSKWIEQRPRQAYEDFVMKLKTAFFALILPALAAAAWKFGAPGFALAAGLLSAGSVLAAFRGRSGGAREFFPASCAWAAPLWVLERAVSVHWAFYWRFARGGYPFGARLLSKGTGRDWIRGRKNPMAVLVNEG